MCADGDHQPYPDPALLEYIFSPAQLFGYLAFILSVGAYLQKSDRRLKLLVALDCVCCVIHFWLLGNYAASAVNAVAMVRSLAAAHIGLSVRAGIFFTVLVFVTGTAFAQSWWSALPIAASMVSTLSIFLLTGIRMRCAIVLSTLLWLSNNIVSGSIGGTMMELTILAANLFTIARMVREHRRARAVA